METGKFAVALPSDDTTQLEIDQAVERLVAWVHSARQARPVS